MTLEDLLEYDDVMIKKIPDTDGGGYSAASVSTGYYHVGDGDTPEEALKSLREFVEEGI